MTAYMKFTDRHQGWMVLGAVVCVCLALWVGSAP